MIKALHIKNFRCISELSLNINYAEGKAPNGYKESPILSFIQAGKHTADRVCPVMALYGPNASGKTTILKAIDLLATLITRGLFERAYQPNLIAHNTADNSDTNIGIEFWMNQDLYHYKLNINKDSFHGESLTINNQLIYQVTKEHELNLSGLPQEHHKEITDTYQLRCVNAKNNCQVKTFLNEIAFHLPGASKTLNEVIEYLTQNIITIKEAIPFNVGIKVLANTFEGSSEEKEQQAIEHILKYLHKLDIPIVNMKLEEVDTTDFLPKLVDTPEKFVKDFFIDYPLSIFKKGREVHRNLKTAHKNFKGEEVWFSLSNESEGTRRLIGLLGFLLAAINEGKTVCIDEIDDSLHSLLVIELIRLFKMKNINTNHAQLIFTIHNTDLLADGLVSMSEVSVVSQRGFSGSSITRLTDIPQLRNADNFRRRYLQGEFGGIPFPYV